MNIGLDLRLFGIHHGGIGRYCQQLFPKILALDKTNRYFIFADEKADIGIKIDSATVIRTKIRHYSLGEQLGFLRLLNKYNLDLVHFPNFNVPIFYKRPFIVSIHDVVHHKIGGAKKSHLLHFLAYKKVIQTAAKNAKSIITVSEASKKDIASTLQIPRNKIEVIYEGASLSKTLVEDNLVAQMKKSYLLKSPYFLFVGVLERKKNIVNLTRGFDVLLNKYKVDFDLVIVGKTDRHYPEIKHQAMDIKHKDHLVFTGEIEDEELAALYKGAHAFTSASLHEGFGLPGVEAMNFGLPLLVSNIEVFNEIYDNSAIYFNPLDPEDIAEKMNLLVRDQEFYNQLSRNSLQRSENFSWDRAAQETLGIYHSILLS